jgi:glycosyltransferase involved in cell wall biosynthesis
MRIGLLMHGANRPLTGVTRVAVELGRALQERSDCDVVFLVPYRNGPFTDIRHESVYLPGAGRVLTLMLAGGPLTSIAARRLRLDLIHDPVGASPFTLGRWAGQYKRVVSIHDAIAFRYPEGYPRLNNFLHRRYVPYTLRNVDAVVTVSDHARADLVEFVGIPPPDVYVAPLGVSDLFHPVDDAEGDRVARRLGLDRPFILSVGVKEARKNLARLILAFEELHRDLPEYQLALVGPTLWRHPISTDAIKAPAIRDRVRLIEYVSDEDLRALYSRASLFVHPSLYEGFGLPVLEAMACGTPVVASDATSIPEVAGDAALLVDPLDVHGLAEAMRRVLTDSGLHAALRTKGFERARQFTWERAAATTAAVYRAVLANGDPGPGAGV